MLPLIKEGKTQVLIEPVDRELRIGEMPIYKRKDGAYVLRRVVDIDEKNYYIRGDNCATLEVVPKRYVLGGGVQNCAAMVGSFVPPTGATASTCVP